MSSVPLDLELDIVPLSQLRSAVHDDVARLLLDAFVDWPGSWPTFAAAQREVEESLAPDRISLIAMADAQRVVGWVGGISLYEERVWELHPLAVRPDCQGRGVGRALVSRLEHEVRSRGGLTLYLGTDDVTSLTSLAGVDLYPDVLDKLARIENLQRHPFGFYLRVGFHIVGVVPDANGFGRPDIMMAKRVARDS